MNMANQAIIFYGDAREVLPKLKTKGYSFDVAITSPPYWNLRDNKHPKQIGLEPTLNDYINILVEVFRSMRDLLNDNGSFFLNIGDLYGDKNLQLLPARLALALQDDGWILRNDIIWYKHNAMPSSVKDRLKNSYEHVFHFSKSQKYYYNLDAIREPHKSIGTTGWEKVKAKNGGNKQPNGRSNFRMGPEIPFHQYFHPKGKNPGDVWEINTKPFPEAHGSVFPEELCRKPILACSKEGGWVLDPFCGSATALKVAYDLGRSSVGIELNEKGYKPIIEKRLETIKTNPRLF